MFAAMVRSINDFYRASAKLATQKPRLSYRISVRLWETPYYDHLIARCTLIPEIAALTDAVVRHVSVAQNDYDNDNDNDNNNDFISHTWGWSAKYQIIVQQCKTTITTQCKHKNLR